MLLANAQSLRNQKTRERAEEGIETKEINDPRTKNLDVYPVLLAPSVLLDMQSTRIHNIPGLMSFAKMDTVIRATYGNPGETRRLENGAKLISQGNGFPISWITVSPTAWFEIEYLNSICLLVQVLLAPNMEQMEQIKQSDSIQAPFCLQCHNCYEIGVYDPKKFVSHCTRSLLTLY